MQPTRRQLLKGSLAAPLVLTARPASAWALHSGAACKVRDAKRGGREYDGPPKLTKHAEDEWLRVRCDIHEIRIQQHHKWKKLEGKYFLGTDKSTFWRVHEHHGHLTAEKTSYTVGSCSARKTGERKYGLCYVDDDMHVVGYGWESRGGRCITTSCWTSISRRPV